ncbi:MAG: hypothetical protein ACOX5G_08755 [Kiritimatiellia bacterium]|jgi:WD40 repeat protein
MNRIRLYSRAACRRVLSAALAVGALLPGVPRAETLERIVSLEDPKFRCPEAAMTLGRDGNVYLSSELNHLGYILRVSPDGARRRGGDAVYAMANAVANSDGIIASANAHFNHSVNLYSDTFEKRLAVPDFLVNDTVGWDAPKRVEAADDDTFYAVDQHRHRILQIAPDGRTVAVMPYPADFRLHDFRLAARSRALFLRDAASIRRLNDDGTLSEWSLARHAGFPMAVSDDGALFVVNPSGGGLERWAPDGAGLAPLALEDPEAAPFRETPISHIAVRGDELFVKRRHATELFRVYSLRDGAFLRSVASDHRRVSLELPSLDWTAGAPVPFTLESNVGGAPRWRAWLTPLCDSAWRELSMADGAIAVPSDAAGIYHLHVAPVANPQAETPCSLHAVVTVSAPGAVGTASVWTPLARVWYGRGEEIPFQATLRATNGIPAAPMAVSLVECRKNGAPLFEETYAFTPSGVVTGAIPASVTAGLAPGRYALAVSAPGFTCPVQPIRMGPGLAGRPVFRVTQYGDYSSFTSDAGVWDFPDAAAERAARSDALSVNQFVNRVFAGRYFLNFQNKPDGWPLLKAIQERLAADPCGPAPESAAFGYAHASMLAAMGARGICEWPLLVWMDAALPMGTSTYYCGPLTPEGQGRDIRLYTETLSSFPAFVGWDWAANWWVTDYDKRFDDPATEKPLYDQALRDASENHGWDERLDAAGERMIGWQVEAQQCFLDILRSNDTTRATASSGPYRRPEVYPPASFSNVDEVDLHYQCEQIPTPSWTAVATDFYKRPGKPAWIHPESINEDGTGAELLALNFLALMRGVDGIGVSGNVPAVGQKNADGRSGIPGGASVFRAMGAFGRQYGPWFAAFENDDAIAIPVSRRQIKTDAWGGIGGRSFTRLWEAFMACLYARHPASFVFAEDAPDLSKFKAVLVVGQQVEPEPAYVAMLEQAAAAGVAIFVDGTCHATLANRYAGIGTAFQRIEKLQGFNNDAATWQFAAALREQAAAIAPVLAAVAPPAGGCSHPEVMLSRRAAPGGIGLLWAVDNSSPRLGPGHLWRMQNAATTRQPVLADLRFSVPEGAAVYDVLARERVPVKDGEVAVQADLRHARMRLYAVLPKPVKALRLSAGALRPGETATWKAVVPGIDGALPLRLELHDAAGRLVEERFATTGEGSFAIPVNARAPLSLSATELVGGGSARVGRAPKAREVFPHEGAISGLDGLPREPFARVFGPRVRDVALSADGKTALLNVFEEGRNLLFLDLAKGRVRSVANIGDWRAYDPVASDAGFAAAGCDLDSGEIYFLHLLDEDGATTRRFALPALPARQSSWCSAADVQDRLVHFALAPSGSWVAAAGNLGLAVWRRDGTLLWEECWAGERRAAPVLRALDEERLAIADGMLVRAVKASDGAGLWRITPDPSGEILRLAASSDGSLLAACATTRSGRIYLVRDGRIAGEAAIDAGDVAVSPDGSRVAAIAGRDLWMLASDGSPLWCYRGDDLLRAPRFSPDGALLAVGSELGSLTVLDAAGDIAFRRDLGAIPSCAWTPEGDLVAATWLGRALRVAPPGWKTRWDVRLDNAAPARGDGAAAPRDIPTTRTTTWSNADPAPRSIEDSVLLECRPIAQAYSGTGETRLAHPFERLFDGDPAPPASPWLANEDVHFIDSGWRGSFSLVIDTFRSQIRVEAVTLVEDPAHPESWMRDARLEYWDPAAATWVFAQYLVSDSARHTHTLEKPIEAARFRLTRPDGPSWPAGNLRFGEIAFHGVRLGGSHPDVVADRDVATLYDDDSGDLSSLRSGFNPHFDFHPGDAASGAFFLEQKQQGFANPLHVPPYGHAIRNWDFLVAETPSAPGQYRYLRFACRKTSPEARGLTLRLGEGYPGPAIAVDVGEPYDMDEGISVRTKPLDTLPDEWTWTTVDLWAALQAGEHAGRWRETPLSIRAIGLGAVGGGVGVDAVTLHKRMP